MPLTIRLTDLSVPQAWILQDASPNNDGIMTAAQAAKLAGLSPGSAGYDLVENGGTALPMRTVLNFDGANIVATDDPVNDRTNIAVTASPTTLSQAYTNGGAGPQIIPLTPTGLGILVDAAGVTSLSNKLPAFTVENSARIDLRMNDPVKVQVNTSGELEGFYTSSVGKIIYLSGGSDDGGALFGNWDNGFVIAATPTARSAIAPASELIYRAADGVYAGATAGGTQILTGLPGAGAAPAQVWCGQPSAGWDQVGFGVVDQTKSFAASGDNATTGPNFYGGGFPILLQTAEVSNVEFGLSSLGAGAIVRIGGTNRLIQSITQFFTTSTSNAQIVAPSTTIGDVATVSKQMVFDGTSGSLAVGGQLVTVGAHLAGGNYFAAANNGAIKAYFGTDGVDPFVQAGSPTGVVRFSNSGGTTIAAVDTGNNALQIGAGATLQNLNTGNQNATVGAAGGASPLPGTPLGYLTIKLADGATVKVPYYNP